MPELRIVYTPETDYFRLGDAEMHMPRQPGDPLLQQLRVNYERLRQSFTDLPSLVGLVTAPDPFKAESKKRHQQLIEDGDVKIDSTYLPLCLCEAALRYRDRDFQDPLEREAAYRTLIYLFSNAVFIDRDIPDKSKLLFFALISSKTFAIHELQSLPPMSEELRGSFEAAIKVLKMYPNFDDVNEVYEFFRRRFEANKVPRQFPLHYLILGYTLASVYSVSLDEKIESPVDFWSDVDTSKMPKDIAEEVSRMIKDERIRRQVDKFGKTKRVRSLDELLVCLPEPKTIITDIYIVDHFQQIAEIGFEPSEFRLE